MKVSLSSGYEMPLLAFGTFKIEQNEADQAILSAIQAGYRHFDCASFYLNEEHIGESISNAINLGAATREELFIATKVWPTQYRDIRSACINSLRRLKLEYLDLYILHWPLAVKSNLEDPPVFTPSPGNYKIFDRYPMHLAWKQMEDLVKEGLVRSIGVSNWTVGLLNDLISYATIPPVCNQFETHAYYQRKALIEFCNLNNVIPMGYNVILKPPNTPYYHYNETALEDPAVIQIAEKMQKTPAQVLIKWNLQRRCGCVVKSVTPSRIQENWQSQFFELAEEDMNTINSFTKHGVFLDPSKMFGIALND